MEQIFGAVERIVMKELRTPELADTPETANQAPLLTGHNLYQIDTTLVEAVHREGGGWADEQLREVGKLMGGKEAQSWGFDANENEPQLHTHDRSGNRRDEVTFHPSWHELMWTAIENQVHNLPWIETRKGANVARAGLFMLLAQNELGHTCPVSMTFSSIAALRFDPVLTAQWESRILSSKYDPRFRPAEEKSGVLVGMGMTEKQGGSDVRANTTRAERLGHSREFRITGHKWFCSAPMCDAFLILAQASKGLSCFFLPRWTPARERNHFHIQRLKQKMGNRSNASSEVEFAEAWAQLVGEEGRGVQTIIEMVNCTRLDCVIAAAALMRQGALQAAGGTAANAKRFSRLDHRVGSRDVADDPARESFRCASRQRARTRLCPHRYRDLEILAMQERSHAGGRSARMSRRKWLRGRIGDASAVPRSASVFHLGRFGERDLPGCAPFAGEGAGCTGSAH